MHSRALILVTHCWAGRSSSEYRKQARTGAQRELFLRSRPLARGSRIYGFRLPGMDRDTNMNLNPDAYVYVATCLLA